MERKSTLRVLDLKDAPFQQPRPGYRRKVLCDESTPTDSLISGFIVMDPGEELDLHYHDIEELQFIVYGDGVVGDIDGEEHPVSAGSFLYCPPGINGAHSFKNTGDLPMAFIYVYPSPGGRSPPVRWVEK